MGNLIENIFLILPFFLILYKFNTTISRDRDDKI